MSYAHVHEPQIRALLGTASLFCEAVARVILVGTLPLNLPDGPGGGRTRVLTS